MAAPSEISIIRLACTDAGTRARSPVDPNYFIAIGGPDLLEIEAAVRKSPNNLVPLIHEMSVCNTHRPLGGGDLPVQTKVHPVVYIWVCVYLDAAMQIVHRRLVEAGKPGLDSSLGPVEYRSILQRICMLNADEVLASISDDTHIGVIDRILTRRRHSWANVCLDPAADFWIAYGRDLMVGDIGVEYDMYIEMILSARVSEHTSPKLHDFFKYWVDN